MTAVPAHAYSAFGVPFAVRVAVPGVEHLLPDALPPLLERAGRMAEESTFELRASGDSYISLWVGDRWLGDAEDPDVAIGLLGSAIRARIALRAPNHVFIHAGAVEIDGRAVVIPGASFSGKSTLVAALLARDATYLSDEFAALDRAGRVHPYPRRIELRAGGPRFESPTSRTLAVADKPVEVGIVLVTTYKQGARLEPAQATAGRGALALLENAVPARERPAEVIQAVRGAVAQAIVLEGDRGEAEPAADAIVGFLRSSATPRGG